jgi:hypothetical protein
MQGGTMFHPSRCQLTTIVRGLLDVLSIAVNTEV